MAAAANALAFSDTLCRTHAGAVMTCSVVVQDGPALTRVAATLDNMQLGHALLLRLASLTMLTDTLKGGADEAGPVPAAQEMP